MYLLSELFLFIPLIVYGCIQIRKLIPRPLLKHVFVAAYICLFLGYPAAELLSHRHGGAWTKYLILCGYYCLPYLLYMVFCVVAVDVAIGLGRLLMLLRPETVSRSGFRSGRLACYLLIPALVVAAGAWNNNRLKVNHLTVEIPRQSSPLHELNIVFASDFHLTRITSEDLVEKFVSKVNRLNPDFVLIGGDVLESDRSENLTRYETDFRKIQSKYGVYAVPGNHERRRWDAYKFFDRSGIKFMQDRVERVDNSFYIAGRKSSRSNRMAISELLNGLPDNLPVILLDHSPTDLDAASKSRVALQLSGHTHNGQLFPVNLVMMPMYYELAWGTMKKGNTVVIVSSGLQAWGPPVKTAGDSEIISIKVIFKKGR